jgi:hypothetical protein
VPRRKCRAVVPCPLNRRWSANEDKKEPDCELIAAAEWLEHDVAALQHINF